MDGEIAFAGRTVSAHLPSLQCPSLITELAFHFEEFICSGIWFCFRLAFEASGSFKGRHDLERSFNPALV